MLKCDTLVVPERREPMKRSRYEYIIKPGFTNDDDSDDWSVDVWDIEKNERLYGEDEFDSIDDCLAFVRGMQRMVEMTMSYTDKMNSCLYYNHKDDKV